MDVLLPLAYFPPISYFAYLVRHDAVLEVHEHFVKQSVRSRCEVMGANGPLKLMAPRVKEAERKRMHEVKVFNEEPWQRLHWRSLEAAYRSSPYFEFYEADLLPMFENEYGSLMELNLDSIRIPLQLLGLTADLQTTDAYVAAPEALDLRSAWDRRPYREKCPAQAFPPYLQVFSDRHPFSQDLSILDLLFCLGPESVSYLQQLDLTYGLR